MKGRFQLLADGQTDFVGPRNRSGRLPRVRTFAFSGSRPWHVWNYRFRGGIRVYNILGAPAERDVQANITSPNYGQFSNPIERSCLGRLNERRYVAKHHDDFVI